MQTIEEFIHEYENNNTWISELNSAQYEMFCTIIRDWNSKQLTSLESQLKEMGETLKKETECVDHMKDVTDEYESQLQAANEVNEGLVEKLDYWEKANDRLQETNDSLRSDKDELVEIMQEMKNGQEGHKCWECGGFEFDEQIDSKCKELLSNNK